MNLKNALETRMRKKYLDEALQLPDFQLKVASYSHSVGPVLSQNSIKITLTRLSKRHNYYF